MSTLDGPEQSLWLLQRLVPDCGVSNVAVAIEMDRPARWWPLQQALDWLVERHPALRTSFPEVGAAPLRVLHGAGEVRLEVEMRTTGPATVETDLRRFAAAPFDLGKAPLVRVGLFPVSASRNVICLAAHHIVVDAASLATLIAELGKAYLTLVTDESVPILPAPRPVRTVEPAPDALSYWHEQVDGFDASGMVIEGARPISGQPTFVGELLETVLSAEAAEALAALRKACRATDAMVLLAVYYLLLRRHGAARDAVVGVMADTRGTADAVGYHVATVPLRVQVDDDMSFTELVRDVAGVMTAAFDHGLVTYELLAAQGSTSATRDPAWWRSRLVRHLFNFRPGRRSYTPAGTGSLFRDVCTGLSRFDLELTVEPVEGRLVVKLLYSEEVHDSAFAARLLDRFDSVLCQAAAAPGRLVADFDLFTESDRRLQAAANRTEVAWPDQASVLELVARAAAAAPESVAVVEDGDVTTYGELVAAASNVAAEIRAHSPEPGAIVAIAAPRSAGTAAAALGVWAAGATYLPLDPDHPAERLAYQLDDAGCTLVIGGETLSQQCRSGRVLMPVPVARNAAAAPELPVKPDPHDPAYLIYTSGSTGRPKGVVLSQANLVNVVRHFGSALAVTPADAMAWLTTFAFDISALELFLPLAYGGRVVVAPDEARTDPAVLASVVDSGQVSIVQATPTTWRLVAPAVRGKLTGKHVLCGGEPLPGSLARRLRETGGRVTNVYGPTETTIWSTAAKITDDDVTVGVPIANTTVAVVDPKGRPLPVGLTGELCIGGDGVAHHYHGRPELTAERFRDGAGIGRHYRTGDLARWRPDGRLELVGRSDRQVKLHSHRIELGEIESVLEEHPDVRSAAVVLRGDPTGDGHLVAFVAAEQREGLDADLWSFAAQRLPGYSVPVRFHAMAALPATANAKVDIPALEWIATGQPVGETVATPPETGLTADLVEAWRSVLGRHTVTRDSNFFLSGGTSLLAVRLARTVTDKCGVPVSMAMIFRAPTPAALAVAISPEPTGKG